MNVTNDKNALFVIPTALFLVLMHTFFNTLKQPGYKT